MKKKEFNRIIGQNISELREAAGFTQDALAERLEISKSFLAHIEQGDRSFSVHTLSSMAEVLGTSADAILFGHTLTSDCCFANKLRKFFKQSAKKKRRLKGF